jgi:hypothetical protein
MSSISKKLYSYRNVLQTFFNLIQNVKNGVLKYILTVLGKKSDTETVTCDHLQSREPWYVVRSSVPVHILIPSPTLWSCSKQSAANDAGISVGVPFRLYLSISIGGGQFFKFNKEPTKPQHSMPHTFGPLGEVCLDNSFFLGSSVARWPKFRPKSSKRACWKKLCPNVGRILPKVAEKGPENIF